MSAAPKLINCKINATYFAKNLEILSNYFKEPETQTPWTCEDFISYFREAATT